MMTSLSSPRRMADSNSQPQVINVNDDDEDVIDQEQLDEYQEMIDQLGSFPVRFVERTSCWALACLTCLKSGQDCDQQSIHGSRRSFGLDGFC